MPNLRSAQRKSFVGLPKGIRMFLQKYFAKVKRLKLYSEVSGS
jgi:hypothetical protein